MSRERSADELGSVNVTQLPTAESIEQKGERGTHEDSPSPPMSKEAEATISSKEEVPQPNVEMDIKDCESLGSDGNVIGEEVIVSPVLPTHNSIPLFCRISLK